MNKFKIINEPYYVGNGCDCCEGWWYDKYFIELNGEWVEHDDNHEDDYDFGEWDKRIYFDTVDEAKAYILIMSMVDVEVIDEGYPEPSSSVEEYNYLYDDFDESSYD